MLRPFAAGCSTYFTLQNCYGAILFYINSCPCLGVLLKTYEYLLPLSNVANRTSWEFCLRIVYSSEY